MGCCGKKKRTVNNFQAARNLIFSLGNALYHAAKTGQLSAPQEKVKLRMETCRACNFLAGNRCSACSCYVVMKTAIASEKCPRAYWE